MKELAIKGGQGKKDGTYAAIILKSVECIMPVLVRRDRKLVLALRKEINVQKERQSKAIINDLRAVTRAAYAMADIRRLSSRDVIITFADTAIRK